MRKTKKILFLLALAGMGLSSCGGGNDLPFDIDSALSDGTIEEPYSDYSKPVTAIYFASGEESITLNKGESHAYSFVLEPSDASLAGTIWSSSNEEVASVHNGVVEALNGGLSTIRVSSPTGSFEEIRLSVEVIVPIVSFDIAIAELNLGYHESFAITSSFDPIDTTQNELLYASSNEAVASVDQSGMILTKAIDGDTMITVSSPYLEESKSFVLHVSETHVSSISIDQKDISRIEVGKTMSFSATVLPEDAYDKDILWEVYNNDDEATPRASISASGVFNALEEGLVTVKATSVENPLLSDSLEIEIYKVVADELRPESESVSLSNIDPTKQIEVAYFVSGEEVTPTEKDLSYEVISGSDVVSVSSTGLLTYLDKGSAVVRVSDSKVIGTSSIDINVVCSTLPSSVTLSGASSLQVGETIDLTIASNPDIAALSDDTIDYEVLSGNDNIEVTLENNILHVKGLAVGSASLRASVSGVRSADYHLTISVPSFLADAVYIVGDHAYNGGSSSSGASWDDVTKAFKMVDQTENAYAEYEYKATISFNSGDQWKIRVGDIYKDAAMFGGEEGSQYQIGRYKTDEAAFLDGSMAFNSDGNVEVSTAGKYNIYYAFYQNEHPEGWYEVYVESAEFRTSVSSLKVGVGSSKTFNVYNWEGTLSAVSNDTSIATVAVDDYLVTVTGVKEGTTTISVSDDSETVLSVAITVSMTSEFTLYLDASAVSYWGEANALTYVYMYGDGGDHASWPGEAMTALGNSIYSLTIDEEDLAKFASFIFNRVNPEDFSEVWNRTSKDGGIAIASPSSWDSLNCWKLNGSGLDYDDGNYTGEWVEYDPTPIVVDPTLELDKTSISVKVGESVVVTAANIDGTLLATSNDTSIATVEVSSPSITVKGVSKGSTTIAVSDGKTDLSIAVSVIEEEVVPTTFRLYFDVTALSWWTSASALTYVHMFGTNGDVTSWPGNKMTATTSNDHIFYLDIDLTSLANCQSFIFNRVNPGDSSVWNRTSKDGGIAIHAPTSWDDANCWKITCENLNENIGYDDGNYTGTWVKI